MSFGRTIYTVRDHHSVDHLACNSKRTMCGLPWLTTDKMFGFAVGHSDHPEANSFGVICERCEVHLARLCLAPAPCSCDEDHDSGPFQ